MDGRGHRQGLAIRQPSWACSSSFRAAPTSVPGGTTRLANVGAVFNCGGLAEVTATGPESLPQRRRRQCVDSGARSRPVRWFSEPLSHVLRGWPECLDPRARGPRAIGLHGRNPASSSSILSASCANRRLQAPRIRYLAISTPMSASGSTPESTSKPRSSSRAMNSAATAFALRLEPRSDCIRHPCLRRVLLKRSQ